MDLFYLLSRPPKLGPIFPSRMYWIVFTTRTDLYNKHIKSLLSVRLKVQVLDVLLFIVASLAGKKRTYVSLESDATSMCGRFLHKHKSVQSTFYSVLSTWFPLQTETFCHWVGKGKGRWRNLHKPFVEFHFRILLGFPWNFSDASWKEPWDLLLIYLLKCLCQL